MKLIFFFTLQLADAGATHLSFQTKLTFVLLRVFQKYVELLGNETVFRYNYLNYVN